MGQLFIETGYVGLLPVHTYLIYRPTPNAPYDEWEIIRAGTENDGADLGNLSVFVGALNQSPDNYPEYAPDGGPGDLFNAHENPDLYSTLYRQPLLLGDITDAEWLAMQQTAASIGGGVFDGQLETPAQTFFDHYDYTAVTLTETAPATNCNAAVASVLAHHGFTFPADYPPSWAPTPGDLHILGTTFADWLKLAPASEPFTPGLNYEYGHLLIDGRNINLSGGEGNDSLIGNDADNGLFGGADDDVLQGGAGNNTLHGGQHELDFAQDGTDTVTYAAAGAGIFLTIDDSLIDVYGTKLVVNDNGSGGYDRLFSIERIIGSDHVDRVKLNNLAAGLEIDGGAGADMVDVSQMAVGVEVQLDDNGDGIVRYRADPASDVQLKNFSGGVIGTSQTGPGHSGEADHLDFSSFASSVFLHFSAAVPGIFEDGGVERFSDWEFTGSVKQMLWNMLVPFGQSDFSGATELRFSDFEELTGSTFNDRLSLWQLNPGGALTTQQRAELDAARSIAVSLAGTPAEIGAAMDARRDAAAAIPQNQLTVEIDGGDGVDVIVGTETGHNIIRGGAGVDVLTAGGFTSEVYGGGDTDILYGNGFKSHLYGGEGTDIFSLSANTFVMDATTEDHLMWGPFVLTGGVQQWWQEGQWAYWAPFSPIVSAIPMAFLNVWGAAFTALDVPAMATFRFAVTEGDQLVIQYGRGRAGQAVVENYSLDLATTEATGNIVVFRQVLVEPGDATLGDLKDYMQLAIAAGFGLQPLGTDPLILDLDGDGIELVANDQADVYFDLDQDAFAERTAWINGDDGFLARDLNGNGSIDDIGELFGNATTPGFTELSALDSNSDGIISAADNDFGTLRVWQDADADGVTDAGELKTLGEVGITEISLTTSAPAQADLDGGTITAESTFTYSDGTTATVADVILDTNQIDSTYEGDGTVSAQAAALPNLKGYGDLTRLDVAMTNDAALLSLVSTFASGGVPASWADLKTSVVDILFAWADVESVAATPIGTGTVDEQKLAFLERYVGTELTPRDQFGTPSSANEAELADMWDGVLDLVAVRLGIQGPLSSVILDLTYDAETDRFFAASVSTLSDAIGAAIGQLSSDPATALAEWTDLWGPVTAAYAEALVRHDGFDVRTDFAVQSVVAALEAVGGPLSLTEIVAGMGYANVQVGTTGNDSLGRGSAEGLFVYVGDDGNDMLTGGSGQDVYVYGEGFGQDVIDDSEALGIQSGDRIRFATLTADQVTIRRDNDDLLITVNGTSDSIRVVGQYIDPDVGLGGFPLSPNRGIEEIQFADGQVFELVDISAAIGLGTSASETIEGTAHNDEIEGLAGDDILLGGSGGDTYFYSRGDGSDTIHDVETNPLLPGSDTLILLGGITPHDVSFLRDGASDDLRIGFSYSAEEIVVTDQFEYSSLGYDSAFALNSRIEAVMFDMGLGLGWLDIQDIVIANDTTDGDDVTYGYGTSDEFVTSLGNDTLIGFDGGDTYHFGIGSGQDTVDEQARYIDTQLLGLAGVVGYDWSALDAVVFADGLTSSDITLTRVGASDDLLIGIDGHVDTLTIKSQFKANSGDLFGLIGVQWIDRMEEFRFGDGTVLTSEAVMATVLAEAGTSGDDTIYGFYREDVIDGGAGNDYLSGGEENDVYLFDFGYGSDVIEENQTILLSGGDDTVLFAQGINISDVTFDRIGDSDDLIVSLSGGSDTITVKDQFSAFYSGPFGVLWFDRIESFAFQDAANTIISWDSILTQIVADDKTSGDDVIYGFSYEDHLDGGAGNDYLSGGNENDTYYFGLGYGADTIDDNVSNILSGMDGDRLVFGDNLTANDITLSRDGNSTDLRIELADGSSVDIIRMFDLHPGGNHTIGRIDEFQFSGSGETLTYEDFRQRLLDEASTAGDDSIHGFKRDDRLDGGAGNDRLEGSLWNDTYVFGRSYGHDVIYDIGDVDILEFLPDLLPSDIRVERGIGVDDVRFVIIDTGETITIEDQNLRFTVGPAQFQIEEIRFADHTTWLPNDLRSAILDGESTSGDDLIRGFLADDLIDGGAGNDRMEGSGGADTYLFGFGSGHDIVLDYIEYITWDQPDTIEFGAGILASDVNWEQVGDDLLITLTGGVDTLRVEDHFHGLGYWRVELFEFEDGSVWTHNDVFWHINGAGSVTHQGTDEADTISGTSDPDVIHGGLGDDHIRGLSGSDTYLYASGDGNDLIDEWTGSAGDADRLSFTDKNAADVTFARIDDIDDDLEITVNATGEVIHIMDQFRSADYGIEEVEFADGTVWDASTIADAAWYRGTLGNDALEGTSDNETFSGGAGDDTLEGKAGSDTYVYVSGDGNDVIDEWSTIAGEVDRLRLLDLNAADVSFARVDGSYDDVEITVNATGHVIHVKDYFRDVGYGIEEVEFADGTVWGAAAIVGAAWYRGTLGNDALEGSSDNETFSGGVGDDTLEGKAGSDTYVYVSGDGNDVIDEWSTTAGEVDRLRLLDLNAADVTFTRINDVDDDLEITVNATGEVIHIMDQFRSADYGIEEVEFADGTVWDASTIADAAWYRGTLGNDALEGTSDNETFSGGVGDDTLEGKAGSDTYVYVSGDGNDVIDEWSTTAGEVDRLRLLDLNAADVTFTRINDVDDDLEIAVNATGEVIHVRDHFRDIGYGIEEVEFADGTIWDAATIASKAWFRGNVGNDSISGTVDDETFDGGDGADHLFGSSGDDVLIGGAGADNLDGGAGTDAASYETAASGVYVHMGDIAQNMGDAAGDTYVGIENLIGSDHDDTLIVVDDGAKVWGGSGNDMITLSGNGHEAFGEAGNDSIYGDVGIDVFDGGDGNDTLFGYEGDDHLIGGAGDDYMIGGDDNDLLEGGDGEDEMHGHLGNDTIIGGAGADLAFGNGGDDSFDLGGADDYAVLGGGADTFIFRQNDGYDTISDFSTTEGDVIELDGLGVSSFSELQTYLSEWAGTTYVEFAPDHGIVLEGVALSSLQADDFRFV